MLNITEVKGSHRTEDRSKCLSFFIQMNSMHKGFHVSFTVFSAVVLKLPHIKLVVCCRLSHSLSAAPGRVLPSDTKNKS